MGRATGHRRPETALLADVALAPCHACIHSDDVNHAMSQDDKLIDLNTERAKRVHDLNEKRLNEVRQQFEQAMPLGKPKKKPKKPKKR